MTNSPTQQEATQILKSRMAAAALRHVDRVGVRTGTMLEHAGLLKRETKSEFDPLFVQVATSRDHPLRIKTFNGPILLYLNPENQNQRFAVDMRQTFLSDDIETRRAAWNYFMADEHSDAAVDLTSLTRSTLYALRDKLVNQDKRTWQEAAIQAHDAIELDLLCQLAGVRQSIFERYEDGLRYYFSKLLEPNPNSFDFLGATFLRPSEHAEEIVKSFESLMQDIQLVSAAEQYVIRFGTLPLAGDLSFTRMVKQWIRIHEPYDNWRNELREWARTSKNPIARFYVALALLEIDGIAEEGDFKFIDNLFGELLEKFENEGTPPQVKSYWTLNFELARHYLLHLETLSPDSFGEPLALAAWWLSSRFAQVLLEFPDALSHLEKVAIEPQFYKTARTWNFSNPTVRTAAPSLATHCLMSPWSMAALNVLSLGDKRSQAVLAQMTDTKAFELSLGKFATFGCATTVADDSSARYLFQLNFGETLSRLCTIVQEPDVQKFLQFIKQLYGEMARVESFSDKLDSLSDSKEIEQIVIVNTLLVLALQDQLPIEEVWLKLVDPEWRTKTFSILSTTLLETLFLSLAHTLRRGGNKWMAGLPHIYAQAAEELVSNTDKAKFLFALTMFSSVHTHSVSAIERILRGKNRSQFIEHGRWWKNVLAESSRSSPPWVSARLRALSAAISGSL